MSFTISFIYDPSDNTFTNNLSSTQDALTISPGTAPVNVTVNLLLPTGTPGSIAFNSDSDVGPFTWLGGVEPPGYTPGTPSGNSCSFSFNPNAPGTPTTTIFSFLVNAVYTNNIQGDPTIVNEGTGQ